MLPRKMSLTGTGGLPVGGIGLGVPGLPPGGPSGGGGLAGAGGLGTQASAPSSANAPGGLDPLAHLSGKNKESQLVSFELGVQNNVTTMVYDY